ncbi:MAG: hypothetical protein HYX69_08800 [Planctomycetia bacterium]|nr:hypothetical protein [Planctomycetia bacterium]
METSCEIEETATSVVEERIPPLKEASIIPSRVDSALRLLLESHDYADDLGQGTWDFAVELASLRQLGITNSDVRWLVGKGLVQHARESAPCEDGPRRFLTCERLILDHEACFVLSPTGLEFARRFAHRPPPPVATSMGAAARLLRPAPRSQNGKHAPKWDRDRAELRVGNLVVRQYKVPSADQEIILAAFEEEHWPRRVDNPLPVQADPSPLRRLQDAVEALNGRQKHPLLQFLAEEDAAGVRWQFAEQLPA